MMLVTIFADASFCFDTKAAGWAGWAKSRRGSASHSGRIKHAAHDPTESEMCAIINAVVVAKKAGIAIDGDTLLIESDSMDALHCFETRSPGNARAQRKDRKERRARRKVLVDAFFQQTTGFQCRFKHVKGHQKNDNPRSYVNNQCDRHAKRHMLEERRHRSTAKETPA